MIQLSIHACNCSPSGFVCWEVPWGPAAAVVRGTFCPLQLCKEVRIIIIIDSQINNNDYTAVYYVHVTPGNYANK